MSLQRQKIAEELHPRAGEDGFGVKLHAFDGKIVVAESHDGAVGGFCGDFEIFGQAFAFDDERMVTRRGEARWKAAENRLPVVEDFASLAMKEFRRAHDFSAKGGANGLMPLAEAEDGDVFGQQLD